MLKRLTVSDLSCVHYSGWYLNYAVSMKTEPETKPLIEVIKIAVVISSIETFTVCVVL